MPLISCWENESSARSIRLELPHFYTGGGNYQGGTAVSSFKRPFWCSPENGIFISPEELRTIILHSAAILGVEIEPEGAIELAKRSRGTPRLANRLLKRVRDFDPGKI